MTTLGQILLQRGWITDNQLQTARRRQKQVGGRLGTAFLEIGAITEAVLLKVLSEQLGVPAADLEDLGHVKPEVSSLLPAKLAVRAEAIPIRQAGSLVDLAMLDVRNLALQDELSFVIGKRLRIHIANEARIHEALQRYYGKECSLRFLSLLDRLNRKRDSMQIEVADLPPEPDRTTSILFADFDAPPAVEEPQPPEEEPPQRTSIPLSAEEMAALEFGGPAEVETAAPATAAAPASEASAQEIQVALRRFEVRAAGADSSRRVGRLLLEELSTRFTLAVLFRVRRRVCSGWMAWGSRVDAQRLARFRAPLEDAERPSVFQDMDASGRPFEGRLAPLAVHREMHGIWGGADEVPSLLCPLRIRDRTVAVIYVDRGGAEFAASDEGLVQQLAARAALALERRIVERKAGRAASVPGTGAN